MSSLDHIVTNMDKAYGLDAYHEIIKNGSMFKPSVIMKKFSDNSFWARDAATRCVAEKIKTPQELAAMVQEAFASDDYKRLAYDFETWRHYDEKTRKLQKELSDKSRFNFVHSVAKMAGVAAMKLNIHDLKGRGICINNSYEENRTIAWDPSDITVAALNINGRISKLNDSQTKGYLHIERSQRKRHALV